MSEDQIAAVHLGVIASLTEAAGLDPATASADDLIAWIRERLAEEWQDISTAPRDEIIPQEVDVWLQVQASPMSMGISDAWPLRAIAEHHSAKTS